MGSAALEVVGWGWRQSEQEPGLYLLCCLSHSLPAVMKGRSVLLALPLAASSPSCIQDSPLGEVHWDTGPICGSYSLGWGNCWLSHPLQLLPCCRLSTPCQSLLAFSQGPGFLESIKNQHLSAQVFLVPCPQLGVSGTGHFTGLFSADEETEVEKEAC